MPLARLRRDSYIIQYTYEGPQQKTGSEEDETLRRCAKLDYVTGNSQVSWWRVLPNWDFSPRLLLLQCFSANKANQQTDQSMVTILCYKLSCLWFILKKPCCCSAKLQLSSRISQRALGNSIGSNPSNLRACINQISMRICVCVYVCVV